MELTPEQYEILFGEPAPHVPTDEPPGSSRSLQAPVSPHAVPSAFSVRRPDFDPEPDLPSTEPPRRRIRPVVAPTVQSYDERPWPTRKRIVLPILVFLGVALSPLLLGRNDRAPEVQVLAEATVVAVNPRAEEAQVPDAASAATSSSTTTGVSSLGQMTDTERSIVSVSELDNAREALVRANVGPLEQAPEVFVDESYLPSRWPDSDGDCQSDFDELLIVRSLVEVTLSEDGCTVERGLWSDPYDGAEYADPTNVTIDITVPLAAAHEAGGWTWDEQTRLAYATDFSFAAAHSVIGIDIGRTKADRAPHEWRPPLESAWCRYAVDWVLVKERWVLTFGPDEVAAIEQMLQTCEQS